MSPSYNEVTFASEYMGNWQGGSEESWFNFEKLTKYRKIKNPEWHQKFKEEKNKIGNRVHTGVPVCKRHWHLCGHHRLLQHLTEIRRQILLLRRNSHAGIRGPRHGEYRLLTKFRA